MPSEQETKTIRYAELTAALCLMLVVTAWFVTSRDFASLVALVTALGAVIAVYRRRRHGILDIPLIAILVIVTGVGLYLTFFRDNCVDQKQEVINCEFSTERAAQLIYGNGVEIFENGAQLPESEPSVRVIFERIFQEQDINKYAFFTQRLDSSECQDCPPFIDGVIFTQVDDKWYLELIDLGITQAGFVDVSPEMDMIEIGPEKNGWLYFYSGENEGLHYKDLLVLSRIGDEFVVIFNDLVMLETELDCEESTHNECWGYTASISFVEGENPTNYDLIIVKDGTIALDDGTVVPISEVKRFRFSPGDNEYIEIQ